MKKPVNAKRNTICGRRVKLRLASHRGERKPVACCVFAGRAEGQRVNLLASSYSSPPPPPLPLSLPRNYLLVFLFLFSLLFTSPPLFLSPLHPRVYPRLLASSPSSFSFSRLQISSEVARKGKEGVGGKKKGKNSRDDRLLPFDRD